MSLFSCLFGFYLSHYTNAMVLHILAIVCNVPQTDTVSWTWHRDVSVDVSEWFAWLYDANSKCMLKLEMWPAQVRCCKISEILRDLKDVRDGRSLNYVDAIKSLLPLQSGCGIFCISLLISCLCICIPQFMIHFMYCRFSICMLSLFRHSFRDVWTLTSILCFALAWKLHFPPAFLVLQLGHVVVSQWFCKQLEFCLLLLLSFAALSTSLHCIEI